MSPAVVTYETLRNYRCNFGILGADCVVLVWSRLCSGRDRQQVTLRNPSSCPLGVVHEQAPGMCRR